MGEQLEALQRAEQATIQFSGWILRSPILTDFYLVENERHALGARNGGRGGIGTYGGGGQDLDRPGTAAGEGTAERKHGHDA